MAVREGVRGGSMAMTIDEAIRHAEDKARELGCTECAQEHRQLAAWLRELKFRRKAQADLDAARWRADEAARKNGVSYDPDAYMK